MINLSAWWVSSFGANAEWAKILVSMALLSVLAYVFARWDPGRVTRLEQARLRSSVMHTAVLIIGFSLIILTGLSLRAQG